MLYFVATPIGNMSDMTYRAVETLKSVDVIACEDTRHSLKLLNFYDIKKPLIAYHKFNEKKAASEIINLLKEGKNVAVISDAGMPVISDPGNALTELLSENEQPFTVIPGASACLSALVLSGLSAANFTFIGFLPEKNKERKSLLKSYSAVKSTLIFYSAPHDVNKDLKDLYYSLGGRKAAAVKEITKIHETVYRFESLENASIEEPKGEFVIVVEGAAKSAADEKSYNPKEKLDEYIASGMSKKDALKKVSEESGISKNALYAFTVREKED